MHSSTDKHEWDWLWTAVLLLAFCAGCGTTPVTTTRNTQHATDSPEPQSPAVLINAQWLISRTGAHTGELGRMPQGRRPELGDISATVVASDASYRMLKLRHADGNIEVLKIDLDSDSGLSSVRVGSLVVVRTSAGPVIFTPE